jgi:hypothetical protein
VAATGATPLNTRDVNDNVAHPTPKGGTTDGNGQGNVDVTDPTLYKSWRGGCGIFPLNAATANHSWGSWGQRTTRTNGTTTFTNTNQTNFTHIYANKSDFTKLCVVTYDVHGGTNALANGGLGIPGAAKNITAGGSGHNDDNDLQKNVGAPFNDACIFIPQMPTSATSPASPAEAFHDTVTLSGGPSFYDGTLNFRTYYASTAALALTACNADNAGTGGTNQGPAIEGDVAGNGTYTSADVGPPNAPGYYAWRVFYSGDVDNQTAANDSGCDAATEVSHVPPGSTSTDTGQKISITDYARVTGTAGLSLNGTVRFALFDNQTTCTSYNPATNSPAPLAGPIDKTVSSSTGTDTVNSGSVAIPAPAGQPTPNGTYYWNVSYKSTDGFNTASASTCSETMTVAGNVSSVDP